jgi:hypothetical protein
MKQFSHQLLKIESFYQLFKNYLVKINHPFGREFNNLPLKEKEDALLQKLRTEVYEDGFGILDIKYDGAPDSQIIRFKLVGKLISDKSVINRRWMRVN